MIDGIDGQKKGWFIWLACLSYRLKGSSHGLHWAAEDGMWIDGTAASIDHCIRGLAEQAGHVVFGAVVCTRIRNPLQTVPQG